MGVAARAIKDAALGAYVALCAGEARRVRSGDATCRTRCRTRSDEVHLRAALHWLLRAQDLGDDAGFAGMYSLVEGWVPSYPETTGYIIPTLFDCARRFHDESLSCRAVEAADWLRSRQLPDGAFAGLFADQPGPPRVFNTGQVILGLVRTWRETQAERFLHAAERAGWWLVRQQDTDGAWRRSTLGGVPHAYNARTAWALAQLADATDEGLFRDSAIAAAEWTRSRQDDGGWFEDNTFYGATAGSARREPRPPEGAEPTLHTIAYAMRGLLETGARTGRVDLIESALRTGETLRGAWMREKHLNGSYGCEWTCRQRWRCLPGEAQVAVAWMRFDQILGKQTFAAAAGELVEHVKAAQFLDEEHLDLFGGVSGSLPIHGPYERYCLVNWGAKFLIDVLLLKESPDGEPPTA